MVFIAILCAALVVASVALAVRMFRRDEPIMGMVAVVTMLLAAAAAMAMEGAGNV